MVKFAKLLLLFTLLIFVSSINAQEKTQIRVKQNELSNLKKQISSLEYQFKQKSQKERETFAALDNFSQQSFLLNKLINKIKAEEQSTSSKIISSQLKIDNLKKEISELQKNYAKYITAIYKYGKTTELESILDANSVQQAVLRLKYLQKFTEQREKDLTSLKDKTKKLSVEKKNLIEEKKSKSALALQKENERKSLDKKLKNRKRLIDLIRKDKNEIKKEIAAKKNAELKIKDLISKLIEEAERKRKAEEAKKIAEAKRKAELREKSKVSENGNSKPIANESKHKSVPAFDMDLSTANLPSFAMLKGKLNWPVSRGRIIRKFGENRNNHLNTITLNYGVDIKTSSDASVKAVAAGIISTINWLPGYGSVVIITHKGNYRTVYSHLGEIFVKEGERVKMGSILGKVGESLEGNILHFEIWNSKKHQNPENWLARK